MNFALQGQIDVLSGQYFAVEGSGTITPFGTFPTRYDGKSSVLPVAGIFTHAWIALGTPAGVDGCQFILQGSGEGSLITIFIGPGETDGVSDTATSEWTQSSSVGWQFNGPDFEYIGNICAGVVFVPSS